MQNSYRYSILLVLLFTACVTEETAVPKLICNQPDLVVNRAVEDVKKTASSVVSQYPFEDIIEAYVVSSDESGNFFKAISFQTIATVTKPAIGFSVPVDATNLYVDYRVGNKVYLKLKNQYSDIYFGGLRIGGIFVNSNNEGGVGRLSQNDYKNVLNASCTSIAEDQLVTKTSIANAVKDANLNTLIEIADVQFSELAVGRHFYDEANDIGGGTNWNLIDKNGNQLIFRTSSFADFSKNTVPRTKVKVKGVLTKFGSDYQLIARSINDIVPTDPRTTPFFTEDFQRVNDKTNLSLPGWANLLQAGSLFWKGTVYGGNGYAEFAISGTKVNSNIAWLISPKIDMDQHTNEVLTFRAAQHHLDVDSPLNALEVFVATDFDGLNVTKANWKKVTFIAPTQATPWYQFIGSGGIDLSTYTGKINIGFKYIGSGKNTALDGAFQIDDIQIYGDN